jgi:hypothetical protein
MKEKSELCGIVVGHSFWAWQICLVCGGLMDRTFYTRLPIVTDHAIMCIHCRGICCGTSFEEFDNVPSIEEEYEF